jgi:hypothetical protein
MTDATCDTKVACGWVEICTGVGRRRRWTVHEKGRICDARTVMKKDRVDKSMKLTEGSPPEK